MYAAPSPAASARTRRATLLATAALGGLAAAPSLAHADYAPALAPGSSYRLVFITSDSFVGSSTSDSTYNSDVTTDALLNASLPSTTWAAITSTGTTTAANNVGSNMGCNSACQAAPIYDLDGNEIASSAANLFSGSLLNGIDVDEAGASSGGYVWTGSNPNGTGAKQSQLGTSTPVWGESGDTGSTWIDADYFDFYDTQEFPLYGISGALTVAGAVPEPTTLALLATGGLAAGVLRRIRRRRKPAG